MNNSKYHADKNRRKLDIRGRMCPMTFVYTKLALEELEPGDVIEVVLDFRPALRNIPDSCVRQNLAEVLEIREGQSNEPEWTLILKKI